MRVKSYNKTNFIFLGTELVHDESEKCLLREVENLRTNQKKLEACLDKCKDQVNYTLIYMITEFLVKQYDLNN